METSTVRLNGRANNPETAGGKATDRSWLAPPRFLLGVAFTEITLDGVRRGLVTLPASRLVLGCLSAAKQKANKA